MPFVVLVAVSYAVILAPLMPKASTLEADKYEHAVWIVGPGRSGKILSTARNGLSNPIASRKIMLVTLAAGTANS
jgi:hypothetical protein